MIVRVSEATPPQLNWMVAKCEGYTDLHKIEGRMPHEPQLGMFPPRREYGVMDLSELSFSSDWDKSGPIIEREGIAVWKPFDRSKGEWKAHYLVTQCEQTGPTLLVAAMRCYVASRLGDEIEIPEELK